MKPIYAFIAIAFISMSCSSSKKAKNNSKELTLTITISSDYCGGAHPNEKYIKELQTPKAYTNKDIMISTSNKLSDDMITLSADSKGEITTTLSPSTYYVYLPEKAYANFITGGDATACKKWKNIPNTTFNVEEGTSEITVNVYKTCSPCGPKPM